MSYLNPFDDFPDPQHALTEPNGLLAVGGCLAPKQLLQAYYCGIFPWFNDDDPILWWSPDPRAVFTPTLTPASRSLAKFLKKQDWTYTVNSAFEQVIKGCASPRKTQDGTWITNEIEQAYINLHHLGKAHSVEVWHLGELIGGLYGIAVGNVFCGESMFHTQTNASKGAFTALNHWLYNHQFTLIDAQLMNSHLVSLGAKAITRNEFIHHLQQNRNAVMPQSMWQQGEIPLEL
nr:leucyl/phenylalanyl-tRNA--protein transferase [Shewanella intestini]